MIDELEDDAEPEQEPEDPLRPIRRLALAVFVLAVSDHKSKKSARVYDDRLRISARKFLFPTEPAWQQQHEFLLDATGLDRAWMRRRLERLKQV